MDRQKLEEALRRQFFSDVPHAEECCAKTGKKWDDCHLGCCGVVCEGDHCVNCGPDV